jgi:recombinational DNA repair protein RecR
MSKKQQAQEIDTYAIGPTVCKNFTNKDLCHFCVAKGMYSNYICFARPTGSINTVKDDEQKMRTLAEVIGGGTT